jgi:hypothetical protein
MQLVYDYRTAVPKAPKLHQHRGVAHRKLHVHENGSEILAVEVPGQQDLDTDFSVLKDAKVLLELTYVDDEGNESEVIKRQKFTATGSILADADGDFEAINKIGEREVDQWPEPTPGELASEADKSLDDTAPDGSPI